MIWLALWVESFSGAMLGYGGGMAVGEFTGWYGMPAVGSVISSAVAAGLRLASRWGALVREAAGHQGLNDVSSGRTRSGG